MCSDGRAIYHRTVGTMYHASMLRENISGPHNQSVALFCKQHRSIPFKELIFVILIKNLRFGA